MTPEISLPQQRVAYTPAEFAAITPMNEAIVRRHIRKGEIKATRIGNRLFIPASEVTRLFGDAA